MTEEAVNASVGILTGLGLPGLCIGVLAYALKTVFGLYTASLEKRVEEGLESRTAIERNTAAITALTDLVKDRKG